MPTEHVLEPACPRDLMLRQIDHESYASRVPLDPQLFENELFGLLVQSSRVKEGRPLRAYELVHALEVKRNCDRRILSPLHYRSIDRASQEAETRILSTG
jgi:hypothetical protein